MAERIANLFVEFSAKLAGLEAGLKSAADKIGRVGQKLQSAGTALAAGVTTPIALLGGGALKAAIDFEGAMAGVAKVTGASDEVIQKLGSRLRDISREMPVAAGELAKIAQEGARLGVQATGMDQFVDTVVRLVETSTLSAEEAATTLARLGKITGTAQSDFDRLATSITVVGNAVAANENEIAEFSLRIAGAGTTVGLTQAEIIGLSGALAGLGIRAEAGGTAMSRVMISIAEAVDLGGDRLERFAEVAGLTVPEFAELFRRDAAEAVITFVEGLGELEKRGESIFQVLEDVELQDIRVRDALLRAASAGDELRRVVEISTGAWKDNTALVDLSNRRFQATDSQLRIVKNQIVDVAIELGQAFTPSLRLAITHIVDFVTGVKDMVLAIGDFSPALKDAIFFIGAAALALGPLLLAVGLMTKAVEGLVIVVGVLTAALTFLSRHPLVLIAGLLVTLGLGFANFVFGADKARIATDQLGQSLQTVQSPVKSVSDQITDLTVKIQGFREQLSVIGAPIEKLVRAWVGLGQAEKALAVIQEELIFQVQEKLNQALRDAADRFAVTKDKQALLSEQTRAYQTAIDDLLKQGLEPTNPVLRQLGDELGILKGKFAALGTTTREAKDILLGFQIAVGGLGTISGDLGTRTTGLEQRLGLARQALIAMTEEATRSARGPDDLRAALQRLGEDKSFQMLRGEIQATSLELAISKAGILDFLTTIESDVFQKGLEGLVEFFDKMTQSINATFEGFGEAVSSAAILGEDFGELMQSVFQNLAKEIAKQLTIMAAKIIFFTLLNIALGKKQAVSAAFQNAAITFGAVYASVTEALPFPLNLILAPILAALAAAAVLAGALAFAEGGIVLDETFARIGERGPEAVLPLNRLEEFVRAEPQTLNLYVNLAGRRVAEAILPDITRTVRRFGVSM